MLLPSIIISIIARILSWFGGGGKRRQRRTDDWGAAGNSGSRSASGGKKDGHKKLFDKDEGEYVDFEEIK